MHHTLQVLKTAMAHATFTNEDVESATLELITELGNDLEGDEASYLPGVRVDRAESDLQVALNDADDEAEEVVVEADDDDAEDTD